MNKYDATKERWLRDREMIHECPYNGALRTSLWFDHRENAGAYIYKLWERSGENAPGWGTIGLLDEQVIALAERLREVK